MKTLTVYLAAAISGEQTGIAFSQWTPEKVKSETEHEVAVTDVLGVEKVYKKSDFALTSWEKMFDGCRLDFVQIIQETPLTRKQVADFKRAIKPKTNLRRKLRLLKINCTLKEKL